MANMPPKRSPYASLALCFLGNLFFVAFIALLWQGRDAEAYIVYSAFFVVMGIARKRSPEAQNAALALFVIGGLELCSGIARFFIDSEVIAPILSTVDTFALALIITSTFDKFFIELTEEIVEFFKEF